MPAGIDGIDVPALDAWLDGQDVPAGPVTDVEALRGGTQNVMARFVRGGERYVLRRPPLHPRPHSDAALLRELRVLEALAGTELPVPRVVAADRGAEVLGVVSYVMAEVDGFSPEVELPAAYGASARRAVGLEAARAAAVLGDVDPSVVGLADLGRPEGFLARQTARWLRELEGYGGHDLPHVDVVADWLDRHLPAPAPPGLMHGDLHLANLLFHREEPRLAAVVDWEMVTVADPLLDLGWLLATGPGPDWGGVFADTPIGRAGGLPDPPDVVAAYAAHSSRDVGAVRWYEVLACFKLGILLEGTAARARAGRAAPAVGTRLHALAEQLLGRARRRAE